jgi:hypothetical protein
MHKRRLSVNSVYILQFVIFGRNIGQGRYEENVSSVVRLSEGLHLLHFSGYYHFDIIKIPSISRIKILRHVPFFKITSEYLE